MNVEKTLTQEWLEKYRLFRYGAVHETGLVYKEAVQERRVRKDSTVKWSQFRTQKIRREITRVLGGLLEISVTNVKNSEVKLKEKEKWARLAAYLGQTINTILNSHDTITIEETLEKLNRYVEKHVN